MRLKTKRERKAYRLGMRFGTGRTVADYQRSRARFEEQARRQAHESADLIYAQRIEELVARNNDLRREIEDGDRAALRTDGGVGRHVRPEHPAE